MHIDEENSEPEMKAVKLEFAEDEDVMAIEHACEGRCAHPTWVYYCPLDSNSAVRKLCVSHNCLPSHAEGITEWGAAFRVDLPLPQFYATDQIYPNEKEAQSACARIAISEGVLKEIKALHPSSQSSGAINESSCDMSLQMWFDKLPRPLPSFFDDKVLTEIHGAVTLDSWAGKARGARFKMHYYFPTFGLEPHRCRCCCLF